MSRRLPDYSPNRDLSRAFERKLDVDFREGKHRTGWYRLPDGEALFYVTLPESASQLEQAGATLTPQGDAALT